MALLGPPKMSELESAKWGKADLDQCHQSQFYEYTP